MLDYEAKALLGFTAHIIENVEEAAENYVNSIVNQRDNSDYSQDVKNENARFDEYDILSAFFSGANWAIENQWHDTSEELPEDNEQVIGRYFFGCEDHNCHGDKIVYCQTNGKDWFTDFGGIAFDIGEPDLWMTIPNLHEKLK